MRFSLPSKLARKATPMSSLLNALLALLGAAGLGFLWRGYSKAMRDARGAREAALEAVRQNRARAKQKHTETMEGLDDVETRNDSLDLDTLGDTIDAVFGDMSDSAGEGG